LRLEQERRFSFDQIIGESPAMAEMIRLARKVAASSDVITADWLPRGMTGDERTVVLKPVVSIS
jgi:transcriptional regulator with GAF, ATPase, and Fis domain